jgi:DedD protein
MAAASTEATEIRRRGRQRLIGAVAIVLLAVVFVPMLLDPDPRPARTGPALTIPPKDQAAPLPAPAPAKAAAPAKAPAVATTAPTAVPAPSAAPAASVTPAQPTATPAQPAVAPAQAGARSNADPVVTAAKSDAGVSAAKSDPGLRRGDTVPKLEGFAVQVGAFRDDAKLAQARETLATQNVPHYTERLETSSGPLTRLRAGPFRTRDAADAAATKLKAASLPSRVVSLP